MGSIDFELHSWGKTIREAYQNAVDEAVHEHGNDYYSGTISSTNGYSDVTNDYKRSGKNLNKYVQDVLNNSGKGSCFAICMQPPIKNTNKTKSEVKHNVIRGTKKWQLKYVVYSNNDIHDGYSKVKSFLTKGEAITFARKRVDELECIAVVKMEKELFGADPTVATIRYKKSSKEKMGQWLFFGVAPY